MSNAVVSINDSYNLTLPLITQIRDIIKGSPFVKGKGELYLKHPSSVDNDASRYSEYLDGAEFDDFTSNTERVMLGRMKLDDASFEPDSAVGYLVSDVDKDGLSMRGLLESCAKNVLEVKWHLLLADYKGLSTSDLETVSIQDIKDANPRAVIKQYARENVLDWAYERINGAMQLTYLLLCESGEEVDDKGVKSEVAVYLRLGIDENGYYQQKRTSKQLQGSSGDWGDKNYILVGGKYLQFIPASIACDEELTSGELPEAMGFLYPIGDLAMYRYRVSADYKECLKTLKPTLHVTGVSDNDWETFKNVNGRDYVASGAFTPNIWPSENTNFQLLESAQSLEQFVKYFEDNKDKVRALGGVFKTDSSVQRTATEILTEAETLTSILRPIADNIETAIKEQVAYCAMFEGVTSQDNTMQYAGDVELMLNREFAIAKLTVEEVKVLLDVFMSGLLPRDEFLKLLEVGGWTKSSAEDLLQRIEDGM